MIGLKGRIQLLNHERERKMRFRVTVIIIVFLLVPLTSNAGVKSADKAAPFWSPMDFGGGVELQYKWNISQARRKQSLKLTLEFRERYDGNYDVAATLKNGKIRTVTESNVPFPITWAMGKMDSGQVVPTEENLPMVSAANLAVTSMMFFSGISRDKQAWERGFSTALPKLPDTTFTATTTKCSAAGLKGKIMKVKSPQGTVSACISPQAGLPLTFRSSGNSGDVSEYILQSYRSRKLNIPALFHKGEPDGFGGIKWGKDAAKVRGLVFRKEESPGVKIYRNKNDKLWRWGVPFVGMDYYFTDGKFSHVIGKVTKGTNWELLKEALFKEYGKAYKESDLYFDGTESYVWEGIDETSIFINYVNRDGVGTMTISSLDMMWGEFDSLFDDLKK